MALTRKDILQRIRYNKRVKYDLMPSHVEQIESAIQPGRMFRVVPTLKPKLSSQGKTLGEFAAEMEEKGVKPKSAPSGPLTPTQDMLINQIPQKYDVKRHQVRSFLVDHLSSRDPYGLVRHLSKNFEFPIANESDFVHDKMGVAAAKTNAKAIYNYISQLEHHLHRQGNKDYGHDIMKSLGDYMDKTQKSHGLRERLDRHFGKPA